MRRKRWTTEKVLDGWILQEFVLFIVFLGTFVLLVRAGLVYDSVGYRILADGSIAFACLLFYLVVVRVKTRIKRSKEINDQIRRRRAGGNNG